MILIFDFEIVLTVWYVFVLLDFGIVLTVWYVFVLLDFGIVLTVWYFVCSSRFWDCSDCEVWFCFSRF
jgi:hypothetical protein